jgi:hypothetical protein
MSKNVLKKETLKSQFAFGNVSIFNFLYKLPLIERLFLYFANQSVMLFKSVSTLILNIHKIV